MTITAADAIARTQHITLDANAVRWTEDELLDWIFDAELEIVSHKPTACVGYVAVDLVEGVVQQLPDSATQLFSVLHNESSGAVCTRTVREDLDRFSPNWPSETATTDAQHYMHSEFDPRTFFVYPQNDGNGALKCQLGLKPIRAETPNDSLSVSDAYLPSIVDYLFFRIWQKQTNNPIAPELSRQALDKFYRGIGVKVSAAGLYTPKANRELERGNNQI